MSRRRCLLVSGPEIGAIPMVVAGTHNPYLVALSILVASFASYVALDLGGHAGAAQGLARRIWLVAAAITMGGGIWSMHFVGMLAFIMPPWQYCRQTAHQQTRHNREQPVEATHLDNVSQREALHREHAPRYN